MPQQFPSADAGLCQTDAVSTARMVFALPCMPREIHAVPEVVPRESSCWSMTMWYYFKKERNERLSELSKEAHAMEQLQPCGIPPATDT